jgi:hypothetical protein
MFRLNSGIEGCIISLDGRRLKRIEIGSKTKCFALIQLFLECYEPNTSVTDSNTFVESVFSRREDLKCKEYEKSNNFGITKFHFKT